MSKNTISVTIKWVKHALEIAAAKSLEISKTSLLKAVKKTPNAVKLNKVAEVLIANQRGSHKTPVNINENAYDSFKEAGKAFGVAAGTRAYWCKQQGTTNLIIDVGEFEFSKLEKGSIEHMCSLAHKSGFHNLEDWLIKKGWHQVLSKESSLPYGQ